MANNFYKSWWREMGAISRGMMFIEGNIGTPEPLDSTTPAARRALVADNHAHPISAGLKKRANRLYRDFLFLGGRPVTPGHYDDIDEPFPQIDDDDPAPRIRSTLPSRGRTKQSQTCATC